MRTLRLAALLLATLVGGGAAPSELLIRDVRLVDGTGAPARENVSILVREGRIAAIGEGLAVRTPAQVIDGAGLTALPGLIDAHVHFVAASGSSFRGDSDATLRELNRQHLRAYLACGVTTVLDAGAFVEVARDLQGWLAAGHPGPRYLTTGPYLRPPGGYGHPRFGEEATPREVEAKLDVVQSLGAAGVKLGLEGGFGPIGGPAPFAPELLEAVVAGARRRGLPLYVHAREEATQREALALGARALLHAAMDFLRPVALSDDFVGRMAASGAYQVTTLSVPATFPAVFDRTRLDDPLTRLVVPRLELETATAPGVLDHFAVAMIGWGAPWTFEFTRPWLASFLLSEARLREAIRVGQQNLLRLHRAGVPIVVGTDAPSPWPDAIFHFHGVQTAYEVALLGEAGLTPLEAIASATSAPARMLGLADEIGTLAPGQRAEIVLVEGAPDRDLHALRAVRVTVQGGVARTPEQWMTAP